MNENGASKPEGAAGGDGGEHPNSMDYPSAPACFIGLRFPDLEEEASCHWGYTSSHLGPAGRTRDMIAPALTLTFVWGQLRRGHLSWGAYRLRWTSPSPSAWDRFHGC